MKDASVYHDELYELYEVYHDEQTTATSPTITVTGKLPHADVVALSGHKLERTRVYIDGVKANVISVVSDSPNTLITVSDTIVSGDIVDIYLATSTGTLENNTATGKIPLVELQVAQGYGAAVDNMTEYGCGTSRRGQIPFKPAGMGTMAITRKGTNNLNNFIKARKNKTHLMILVKDTTDPAVTLYDIIHEVRVSKYRRGVMAQNDQDGVVMDLIDFRFVPGADVRTATIQHATSYDNATLSGAPLIIKFQTPDKVYKYAKVYPTTSLPLTGEVADPVSGSLQAFNDAVLSGTPTVVEIQSGEHGCLLKVYPTISSEVEAQAGILLYPPAFGNMNVSGTPRVLAVPIAPASTYYIKGYPTKSE
jgi:hypothetical protein